MTNANTEEAHALAGLTEEERRLSAGDEPTLAPEPEPTPELREEISVPLKADVPDGAHDVLSQLNAYESTLAARFDDGDITTREYRDEMARVNEQRERVNWTLRKAELASEMKTTAERAAWEREVSDFMTSGPGSAIRLSETQMVAFDNIVRRVTADPANARLSDRAQLEHAWRLYQQDMAQAGLLASDALATASALGGTGGARSDGGLYAQIDQMAARGDVAGVERALSRMSPAERDRYGY